MNKRFEQLADEEKEKNRGRDNRRLGPPPVANSRFAAAAEADKTFRDDRGPPPQANSRFAAAAEADRSNFRDRDDRGPPEPTNSRFASAAEADRSSRDDRGPPPQANSRFAAAAAMAEKEDGMRDRRDRDRDGPFNRNDGPPVPQNSRFAMAAAADRDYNDRGDRDRFDDRGGRYRDDYDRRGRDDRRGGQDDYDRRGYDDYDRRDGRGRFGGEQDRPFESGPPKRAVDDLLKPKAPVLAENILKVPSKEHADNVLKVPSKNHADNILMPKQKEAAASVKQDTPQAEPSTPLEVAKAVDDRELIEEFTSGGKTGEELKTWCEGKVFPSVERLVFHLLDTTEKLNPNPECGWADPSKYGAALVSLVEDDLIKQVEVLFAIQKYCDKLGFPKLNEEYVVQAMFRSMYKYDLAESDAFSMWKEDESSEHETGKLNAVIQTVDWFNWLEEDDDDEDDEDYEDEE